MTLKISISGIRGIYGESLTDDVVRRFGIAYAKYLGKGTVLIGSDTRKSGPQIKDIIFKALRFNPKIKIIDVGYVPTPTVQVLTKATNADGGIILTASHNPKQWNGLKFVRADGIFLPEDEAQKLIALYHAVTEEDILKAREGRVNVETDVDMAQQHIQKVLQYVNVPLIKKANLKVVIDTCCGAGAIITPKLLTALGVSYTQINAEPDIEKCQRNLEPIAANLGLLGETVRSTGAVVGFAQDPDGDRLAIVNEKGEPIGEDYTLCLVAEYLLSLAAQGKVHGEKAICTNLSTTRIIDDIAKKFGAEVVRTKIGEVNVSLAMKRTQAVTGGEGNGGIMVPAIGFGRDSLAGIALLLQYLAETKKTISELVAQNPKYVMYKTKIDCTSDQQVKEILAVLAQRFAKEKLDKQDGLKVIFADGNWLHVRASNTEPIIRIIAEAETLAKAQALAQQAL